MIKEHYSHSHNDHHKEQHSYHELDSHPHNHKQQEMKEKHYKESQRLEYNDSHHLNELLKEILAYYKDDGYDRFEELSMFIKRKMTKLSFQYRIPKHIPKKCIDITNHEEKILVKYKLIIRRKLTRKKERMLTQWIIIWKMYCHLQEF